MRSRILLTTAIGAAMALGVSAQAADISSGMQKPYDYKNAQPNAHAQPNSNSVNPQSQGGPEQRPYVYSNGAVDAHAKPEPGAVAPTGPENRQNVYSGHQTDPHATPHAQSVTPNQNNASADPRVDAKSGKGNTLTLTQSEADGWKMRPVVSSDGKTVGHVAAMTLNKNGRVADIRVAPNDQIGGKTFAVRPSKFDAKAGKIVLSMNQSDARQRAHE